MSRDRTFTVNVVQPNGERLTFNDVMAVRIVDQFYNLLVMKDYMPIIGKVDGSLTILGAKSNFSMKNGVAYFVNHNNFFTVIMKGESGKSTESENEKNFLAEEGHEEGN